MEKEKENLDNHYYTFRRGNYNLLTNERSPYGRGLKGIFNIS